MSDRSLTSALRVAVLQTDLVWQDAAANLQHFSALLAGLRNVELVVLPEMFNSGFSMQSQQIAETMTGPTLQWLQQQARFYQFALCGSLAIQTELGVVNRLVFVHPDGNIDYYDKRHLFRMAAEHQHYVAGRQRKIVVYRGFRLCLQICYDLRFPVFSRNRSDYDVLIYVANWPAVRSRIWTTLLAARAIENQSYLIGCNRVGVDANRFDYSGDSVVLDYLAEPLAQSVSGAANVLQATLDLTQLHQFRQRFPAAMDADSFVLLDEATADLVVG